MERLTEKRDGQNVIPLRQDGKVRWALCSAGMGDALTPFLYGDHANKLAEYEDLEEQGLLLKLPCKAGNTIWLVGNKHILDYKVSGFAIDSSGISIIFLEKEIDGKMYTRSVDYTEIGKTAFLTKKEAQKALKRDGENSQSKIMAEDVSRLANAFGVNFTQKDTDKLQKWIDKEEQGSIKEN